MTFLYLCFLLLAFQIQDSHAQNPSSLETVAAGMAHGSWVELITNGMDVTFRNTGGRSNMIMGYADSLKWDPVTKRAFFLGSDHGGFPPSHPNSGFRFVAYSESTNTWSVLSIPPWISTQSDLHGYDHTALDPLSRTLYKRPYNSSLIFTYGIDSGVWSQLPPPGGNAQCCEAIEFFPERNGLVWLRSDNVVLFSN